MNISIKIPLFLLSRSLKRGNKWTLGLTVFLMSIAFVNLIFITSLFNGIVEGANNQIISTLTGNIYMSPKAGEDFIENPVQAIGEIEAIPGVVAASSEVILPATLSFNSLKGGWNVIAINPEEEKSVTTVSETIISGRYLTSSDTDAIVLGKEIAGDVNGNELSSLKGVAVGDVIQFTYAGAEYPLTVVGIFDATFSATNERAFITQKTLTGILPSLEGKATNILIKTEKTGTEQTTIKALTDKQIAGRFFSWKDMSGIMESVTKSFVSINVLLTFVGILIAATTIFIVIYIEIANKRRSIGILRAIGLQPGIIAITYITQAAIFALFGIALGSLLFVGIVVPYFKAHPFELPICKAVMVIDYADYAIRAGVVILVALISGVIPALLITRSRIIEALSGR